MSVSPLTRDPFSARDTFETSEGPLGIYRLSRLEELGLTKISALPYSIRVLLEAVLRNCDGYLVTEQDVKNVAGWNAESLGKVEAPFMPSRVVLQDFTGVPAVVDLAAMRDAMEALNGDPEKINPLAPVDLVIDHSVMVDAFGSQGAFKKNVTLEYERNGERYAFLRWGAQAFNRFRVVPPGTGICHQVNLEHLGQTVWTEKINHISHIATS